MQMKNQSRSKMRARKSTVACLVVSTVVIAGRAAEIRAQGVATSDIEVPSIILESEAAGDKTDAAQDSALDLANVVQSASKGVTTVQEAPAIVTVVTADEIKERQFHILADAIDSAPGWYRAGLLHGTLETPLVRGQPQAVQFLHDSMPLLEPSINAQATNRIQPMEIIKRIEMITGPGGVLWGSNSLLGILNVITKDAEDVDGFETGATLGGGIGDRRNARAYVMYGNPEVLDGKLKVFGHASVETYQGTGIKLPLLFFNQPPPQPNSDNIYGPLTLTDQPRSTFISLNGKVTYGKLQLRLSVPFGTRYFYAGLSGAPFRQDLQGDDNCLGATPDPTCVDPNALSRKSRFDNYDRYAALEYRSRFNNGKAGIGVRGYASTFLRSLGPLQIHNPSSINPGGLSFQANNNSYRAGLNIDGDVELSKAIRVQYGAEGFSEWKPVTTDRSRQGTGIEATFVSPVDLTRLPVLCPRKFNPATGQVEILEGCPVTFAFEARRTVFGVYVNPQWRPSKKLILDIGARLQAAPSALGTLSYPLNAIFAGTAVWNFIPNWFAKLNYAQGFRPPIFNNNVANGRAIQIGGRPDLSVETSDALQGEVNARIFKGQRRIRELSFRADVSYTRLQNLVSIQAGVYENSADRVLTSAELLAKLYVQGGHRIELSYTWLQGTSGDKGRLRYMPAHWFNLSGVWNLAKRVSATSNIRISGAGEDTNRLIEYRDLEPSAFGGGKSVLVTPADLVVDRIPAAAELSVGVSWQPMDSFTVSANMYNALRAQNYQPDAFFDYEPRLEFQPNPSEGFRAYLNASYSY
jgi:outer membrane receptor protein involved in Fe transport